MKSILDALDEHQRHIESLVSAMEQTVYLLHQAHEIHGLLAKRVSALEARYGGGEDDAEV